jgi:hypothetical protein
MPGTQQAAVYNFPIISPYFLRRDISKSLLRYGVRKNVLDFSTTFALGAGICARGSWLKTGKIFTPAITDHLELRNNFPSLIFWLVIACLSVPFSFHHGGDKTSQ